MAAECDFPQWHIVSSNVRRDLPRGVMAYTTRGGVSAYTVRSTIPVLCRSRSCWERVRCVIPVIARFSSENRFVPWKSCSRVAAFQRPPTIRAVVSTGQSSGRLAILDLVPKCIPCTAQVPVFPCNHALPFFIYLDREDIEAGFVSGALASEHQSSKSERGTQETNWETHMQLETTNPWKGKNHST